jgi:TRAP-type uncharacterized transport system substrate-binding protein
MAIPFDRIPRVAIPHLHRNRVLAILAVLALVASVGFWYWSRRDKVAYLSLASGVELKYRKNLTGILCEEAAANGLKLDIQSNSRSTEEANTRGSTEATIKRLDRHELDAAVIPAGLAIAGENVRQVAMLECETLHLFLKPELLAQGVAGLRGRRVNLGPPGSGVGIIAKEILEFMGMKAGTDYQADAHSYIELLNLSPQMMPDAIFGLSPLPSPMGERLVRDYGYQLMELPFGEALALRKPYLEDTCVPANTYGVHPAVPEKPLHSVGTRSVLIAHCDVSTVAIRRLLEVLYESDFARRVGMQPLDVKLLQRSGEYPTHAGTVAYLRRHDPLVNKDIIENLKSLRGMIVSAASALILAWQWYRRRRTEGVDDYLRVCNKLELDALRASAREEFGEAELHRFLAQLAELKIDVLEKHQEGVLTGGQPFAELVSRIERLQQTLPSLVLAAASEGHASAAVAKPRRKAA